MKTIVTNHSVAKLRHESPTPVTTVEVVTAAVRLTLEDLAALRDLRSREEAEKHGHNANSVRCVLPSRVESKLRLLGLIEDKELPVCPKRVAAAMAARKKMVGRVVALARKNVLMFSTILAQQYEAKVELSDKITHDEWDKLTIPKPKTVTVLTQAGRDVLVKGTTRVNLVDESRLPKGKKRFGCR